MMMRALRVIWATGLTLGAMGCNEIAGVHEGIPLDSSGSEPIAECSAIEDCKADESECHTALRCEGGRCLFEDALEGTPLKAQIPGDCAERVCNGAGGIKIESLEMDVIDDGDVCTLDACDGATPTHVHKTELPCYTGPAGTQGVGICAKGTQHCDEQGNPLGSCEGEVLPAMETCISPLDEDCDGKANEEGVGCVCQPGAIVTCYTGSMETQGVGACHNGMQSCKSDGLGYGDCLGEQTPQAETCDGGLNDEDCDGEMNEEGADCVCGDGYLSAQEECDDGGTSDGDACSPTCEQQKALRVTASEAHSCALLNGGVVKCWGYNGSGQLGLGDASNRGDTDGEMGGNLLAVNLGAGMTISEIAAGRYHMCVILNDNNLKCWGRNNEGQLGLGDALNRGDAPNELGDNLPALDLGTGRVASVIAAGSYHTCAILNDSSAKCWGRNMNGELGLGDTANRGDGPGEMGDNLPTIDLGTGRTAYALAAGRFHTCALLNGGDVKCWGRGLNGELGLGNDADRGDGPSEMGDNLPIVDLGTGEIASAIAVGGYHTCALLSGGSVKCWGWNSYGQLGLGDNADRGDGPNEMGDNLPTIDLGTGKTAIAIIAGYWFTCAVLNDGSVKCWGINADGVVGLGDTANRGDEPGEMGDNLPPINFGAGKTSTAFAAGGFHACAVLNDASVKCWGDNSHGQLGLGDTAHRGDEPNEMGDYLPTVKLFSDLW